MPSQRREDDVEDTTQERRGSRFDDELAHLDRLLQPLSAKMDGVLSQSAKVAVLEERSLRQQSETLRAEAGVTSLGNKHEILAKEVSDFISYVKGMTRMAWVLWTVIGSAQVLLLVKMLLLAAN